MPFVIDASIAAYWAFDDEDHPVARRALERIRSDWARVPALWWFEVRNTLLVNRKRIAEREVTDFLRQLPVLEIRIDTAPHENDLLALARKHRLSVYDAVYLELARREGVPLASFDGKLADAAPAERVSLLGS